MKKIYLVGKFTSILESILNALGDDYEIQMCSDKVDVFCGMLGMRVPDMFVISAVGFDMSHSPIFNEISLRNPDIPAIVVGTESECRTFESYFQHSQFSKAIRPVTDGELLKMVQRRFEEAKRPAPVDCGNYVIDPLEAIAAFEEELFGESFKEEVKPSKVEIAQNAMQNRNVSAELKSKPGIMKFDNTAVEHSEDTKTILLIDDNPVQLRVFKSMLQKKYNVKMAKSGQEAIEIIRRKCPDLIYLDFDMPEMNGKETYEIIRREHPDADIPIVFVTGVKDPIHIKQVLSLHPAGYILKPVDTNTLNDKAGSILGV